jgi:hypothetical protein
VTPLSVVWSARTDLLEIHAVKTNRPERLIVATCAVWASRVAAKRQAIRQPPLQMR